MSCQDWHALIKVPQNECNTSCQKEAYYKILNPNPTPGCPLTGINMTPEIQCNEPELMNIRVIRCPPKPEPPIGLITRNQDVEIVGSKLVRSCTCGARNGLDVDCPRASCRSNPACSMRPHPRCWPQYKPQGKPEIKDIQAQVQLCYVVPKESHKKNVQGCGDLCCMTQRRTSHRCRPCYKSLEPCGKPGLAYRQDNPDYAEPSQPRAPWDPAKPCNRRSAGAMHCSNHDDRTVVPQCMFSQP